jgi:NADH-quinone oxidoreductase subunit E
MDQAQIDQVIASFPEKKSALLPLLHMYQRERGWISPETMEEVGGHLGLSAAQVLEVVSFYTLFRREPVGKYHVQLCKTTSCYLCGAFDLLDHLTKKHGMAPGKVTPDGRFSLELVECIALCHKAPAIQINMEFHGGVTPERVDEILDGLA